MSGIFSDHTVMVRGGGDLASGTIHRLVRCGFPVIVLEIPRPSAIRRQVAFCEAVYDGAAVIEGVTCRLAASPGEARKIAARGEAALLIDPECRSLKELRPWALVDAILAKKNLGTSRSMASRTIALGPGFCAGKDVDLVIETKRGHDLGRIITEGYAAPDTGVPGTIGGYGRERVVRAPADGILEPEVSIGSQVETGQLIARIFPAPSGKNAGPTAPSQTAVPVYATLSGLVRGMIRAGYPVTEGLKIADIDPRKEEYANCFTISDKARCIAGSVLESLLWPQMRQTPDHSSQTEA